MAISHCHRCNARLSSYRMIGDTLCAPCQRAAGEWVARDEPSPFDRMVAERERSERPRCPCGLLVEKDRYGLYKRWCTTCRKQRTWANRRLGVTHGE